MSERTETLRCPILTGRVWSFGVDVPASCIVPAGSAKTEDPGRLLMTPVDAGFPERLEGGEILAAGSFGNGTTDEWPVRAICAAGVSAVVASTLDPAFTRFARRIGLPVLEVYEAMGIHTGEILRVDLEGGRVVNLSSGNRYPIRNLDEDVLEIYRRHLDDAGAI